MKGFLKQFRQAESWGIEKVVKMTDRTKRTGLKFCVGVGLSLLLCYLVFRGTDFRKVLEICKSANVLLILCTVLLCTVIEIIRSLRWGLLLVPVENITQKVIFPITCIGVFISTVLPVRLGEVVRPYLLSQNTKVRMSAAVGTIVMERIIDGTSVFVFFCALACLVELPRWVVHGIQISMIAMGVVVVALAVGSLRWIRTGAKKLFQDVVLPGKAVQWVEGVLASFYMVLNVLRNIKAMLMIILLSLSIWTLEVLGYWIMFHALGVQLGFVPALCVMVFTAVATAIPLGPAFIGSFHLACILALTFFGISKDVASAYAILTHFIGIGNITILGMTFMNISKLDLRPGEAFLVKQ